MEVAIPNVPNDNSWQTTRCKILFCDLDHVRKPRHWHCYIGNPSEVIVVLFDRLERAGGMENPIKKALHEGKLEKYNEQSRKKCEDSDDD